MRDGGLDGGYIPATGRRRQKWHSGFRIRRAVGESQTIEFKSSERTMTGPGPV